MASAPPPITADPLPETARKRWRANLEALAQRQAELARMLGEIEWPAGASIATGRDGAVVAIHGADNGTIDWLGGTSMPTVSAREVLGGPADRNLSVALASVGSGYEAMLLADRLDAHAAVFVCAPDPVDLILALHAVDWTRLLRSGRIVPLAGDIEMALRAFIEHHPGYQVPARVQRLPDVTPAELAERAAAVQRGAQQADTLQRRVLVRIGQQIARRRGRRKTSKPRVLVLSTDAVGGAIAFSQQVENGLVALGHDAARCVPDGPERCHRIARLTALRDHDPDGVLLLNNTPGGLGDHWPAGLPFACWFLESDALPGNALTGLADCENLIAASTAVRDRLVSAGARTETIHIVEPGVDDTAYHPLPAKAIAGAKAFGAGGPCDFAVIADGCDLSPAAAGIGLESHERLWRAAVEVCVQRMGAGEDVAGDGLLARAEKVSGVRLTDTGQRGQFSGLLTARVLPTVAARVAVATLRRIGTVGLWGAGWYADRDDERAADESASSSGDVTAAVARGPLPAPNLRNRLYQAARLVVFPNAAPTALGEACAVLAAGGRPLIAQPDATVLARYPAGRRIFSRLPAYSGCTDLFTAAGDLAKTAQPPGAESATVCPPDGSAGDRALAAVRADLLREHTLRQALARVLARISQA
jgi:hypothetical protein